jgi:hypothetical protein
MPILGHVRIEPSDDDGLTLRRAFGAHATSLADGIHGLALGSKQKRREGGPHAPQRPPLARYQQRSEFSVAEFGTLAHPPSFVQEGKTAQAIAEERDYAEVQGVFRARA